jgi:hypothetical protein
VGGRTVSERSQAAAAQRSLTLVAGSRKRGLTQSGRSNSVRAIPTVLEIKDLLVDDGLGWASFTSKYPRPEPAGLLRPLSADPPPKE